MNDYENINTLEEAEALENLANICLKQIIIKETEIKAVKMDLQRMKFDIVKRKQVFEVPAVGDIWKQRVTGGFIHIKEITTTVNNKPYNIVASCQCIFSK